MPPSIHSSQHFDHKDSFKYLSFHVLKSSIKSSTWSNSIESRVKIVCQQVSQDLWHHYRACQLLHGSMQVSHSFRSLQNWKFLHHGLPMQNRNLSSFSDLKSLANLHAAQFGWPCGWHRSQPTHAPDCPVQAQLVFRSPLLHVWEELHLPCKPLAATASAISPHLKLPQWGPPWSAGHDQEDFKQKFASFQSCSPWQPSAFMAAEMTWQPRYIYMAECGIPNNNNIKIRSSKIKQESALQARRTSKHLGLVQGGLPLESGRWHTKLLCREWCQLHKWKSLG